MWALFGSSLIACKIAHAFVGVGGAALLVVAQRPGLDASLPPGDPHHRRLPWALDILAFILE